MATPRAVILVRHGESQHHVLKMTGGWTDTSLTEQGHAQARLVAARLRDELPAGNVRIFTSDLLRAGETAAHIAEALGTEARPEPSLREHNNGAWAGLTIAEARARWPDAVVELRMHSRMVDGAETGSEFYARARSFIDELDGERGLPVVVTHGGTLRMLVAAWLRMSDDALEHAHFASLPTGITVLLSWGDGGRERMVERVSDIAHLSGTDSWTRIADVIT